MYQLSKVCKTAFPVLLALMMAAAAFGENPEPSKKTKVFLLAGQSNMDGRGDGSKLTEADRARMARAQPQIRFAYNRKPVIPLDITTPDPWTAEKFKLQYTFGPELFFGLDLSNAWPDEPILFIKRSVGGTSLYGCWNPDWSIEKARVMGEENKPRLYADFIRYIKEVLAPYPPDEYEICAMLWVQGEADSGVGKYGPEPAEAYGRNLQNLIQGVRRETGVADLPFLILQVGQGKVVQGMQEAARALTNVSFIAQSSNPQAPNHLPGYGPPIGHYNYEGMKRIGELFAQEYLKTYSPKKNPAATP